MKTLNSFFACGLIAAAIGAIVGDACTLAYSQEGETRWLWLDDPRVEEEPWILGWEGYTLEQRVNNSFSQCEAEVLGYLGWHDEIQDRIQANRDQADSIDAQAEGPPPHPDKAEINSDTDLARDDTQDAEDTGDVGRFLHGNPASYQLDAAYEDKTAAEIATDPDEKRAKYNACLTHLNAVWPHIEPMKDAFTYAEGNMVLAEISLNDAQTTLDSYAGGDDGGMGM